jgi:hypothetical protein
LTKLDCILREDHEFQAPSKGAEDGALAPPAGRAPAEPAP